MNLGQIFETQLAYIGKELGIHFETPVFDGAKWEDVQAYAQKAKLSPDSKIHLRDGRSGEFFQQAAFVGRQQALDHSHARPLGAPVHGRCEQRVAQVQRPGRTGRLLGRRRPVRSGSRRAG